MVPEGANQDIHIGRAVPGDITNTAGVGAARTLLQLMDDFHAANFRTTGDGAAREHGAKQIDHIPALWQLTAHIGDNVLHGGIALNDHAVVHLDRTRHADTPEIITLQIDQHDMLGPLLLGEQ